MAKRLKQLAPWALVWLLACAAGAVWLGAQELARQREAFEADIRIAHRLLSQRVVQHDAVLATLALLGSSSESDRPEQRLPAVYPQIVTVLRKDREGSWPDARLDAVQAESRRLRRAVLGQVDLGAGRYQLLLGAEPSSFLLLIDIRSMVPWSEWPMARDSSPARLSLGWAGQSLLLQPGQVPAADSAGWRFELHKALAADSQPFELTAQRHVGWHELPWIWMAAWSALMALVLLIARLLLRQRRERLRAEELLRLGQVARLNTLGELAAGMAHELNQPLTAVLANTQAASRLLQDDPPDVPLLQQAMARAVEQARRAADVIGRLRRTVERPELGSHLQPVRLQEAAGKALYLLEPEFRKHQVAMPDLAGADAALQVLAEPVALEQIIHNLLMNALQAMDRVPAAERRLSLVLDQAAGSGRLTLGDSGPGFEPEVLARIFEPFFSTREGGLGLGLSLCETLASGMGGALTARNRSPRGAEFCLSLPLAGATP